MVLVLVLDLILFAIPALKDGLSIPIKNSGCSSRIKSTSCFLLLKSLFRFIKGSIKPITDKSLIGKRDSIPSFCIKLPAKPTKLASGYFFFKLLINCAPKKSPDSSPTEKANFIFFTVI